MRIQTKGANDWACSFSNHVMLRPSFMSVCMGRLLKLSVLICCLLLSVLTDICLHTALAAAPYPTEKPIRMINGFPAGGATDKLIRSVSERVSKILGQAIIIEYKPGAGGAIALETTARAAPDGYTLHVTGQGPMTFGPALRKASFDPVNDFSFVAMLCSGGTVLVVRSDSPATDFKTYLNFARTKPESWIFGTSGVGGSPHLAAEQFKLAADLKITHIPYKGGGPAMTDLLGGHVPMLFSTQGAAAAQIEAGLLRPLAVTSGKRSTMLPEVPTLSELGFQGFDATAWFGVVAPAGLPSEVMDKLVSAFKIALADPTQQAEFRKEGYDTTPMTPTEMKAKVQSELKEFTALIEKTGMKPD